MVLKVLGIILQFSSFIIFRILYEPLNRILVDIYGCGCKEGFNCNNINSVIIFVLFGLSLVISILLKKIYKNKKTAIVCTVVSIVINILLLFPIWTSMMWK